MGNPENMAASKIQRVEPNRAVCFSWFMQHPAWLAAIATLLVLIAFLGKPFNMDDPLFIWVAQHIQSHPLNPYGFNLNWYGFDWPMSGTTQNPPLNSYYLSLVGSIFGWSEPALHAALLLPAIAAVVGTYRLADHFCKRPLLAALLTLFCPGFLVSSTTIMCDVPMLAFWVWALVFWMEATEHKSAWRFAAAALLISLAALTKYFGACLIPLVALWSIAGKRPAKEWLGWLLIPVITLLAYQLVTRALYGHGLLADAGVYAKWTRGLYSVSNARALLTALAFAGGCLAPATFFAPILWSRRGLPIGTAVSLPLTAVLLFLVKSKLKIEPDVMEGVQIILWASGGISLAALAVTDVCRQRDANAVLLGFWVFGTFLFTAFLNWTINARSLLPMTVPVAILVARRLEQRTNAGIKISRASVLVPCVAGAALAFWVAFADYAFASASKKAASAVYAKYGEGDHRLWFQGHWGFQYYLEEKGALPMELKHAKIAEGDYLAIPSDNSNTFDPPEKLATQLTFFSTQMSRCLTTMHVQAGSGFYASVWGPLPFAFGPPAYLTAYVYVLNVPGEPQKAVAPEKPNFQ